jgi:hypothetical protein
MLKKIVIGVSIAIVVIGLIAAAVVFRSRALNSGTAPGATGAPTTAATGTPQTAAKTVCGNGICELGENPTCAADCAVKLAGFFTTLDASEVAPDHLTITWAGSEPTTGIVKYGQTDQFELGTVTDSTSALSHSDKFTGLAAGTVYSFQVTAKTVNGTEKAVEAKFETGAAALVTRTTENVYERGARLSGVILKGKSVEDLIAQGESRLLTREEKGYLGYVKDRDILATSVKVGGVWTVQLGLDANAADSDHDGLPDDMETKLGTDPHNPDTDDDGMSDGFEVYVTKTNPLDSKLF